MKHLLIILSALCPFIFNGTTIYDLQVKSIFGDNISLSDYKGQKIIISEFDAANPDTAFLQSLNGIASSNSDVAIIAVPAGDFTSNTVNLRKLQSLRSDLSLNFIITQPASITKKALPNQQSLFGWLTNVSDNNHFDQDVSSENQLYVISESGILYAVLGKATSTDVINQVLSQQVSE